MQYLGGKALLSRRLSAIINAERGDAPLWEPFCGGAWMTRALGKNVWASDVSADVIRLYRRVRLDGVAWLPDNPTRAEVLAGRVPGSDGFAFFNIACAFGGKPGAGPAVGINSGSALTYAQLAKRHLLEIAACPARFECCSFFDATPRSGLFLYCDPPYRGTAGYGMSFDSDAFERRVSDWAAAGSVVFVSEFAFSLGTIVFERTGGKHFGNGKNRGTKTERLYRVAT